MKRLILAIAAIMMYSGSCFAGQTQATAGKMPPQSQPEEDVSFTGRVALIIFGDTSKGTMPKIAVVSDKGEKLVFTVHPGTHVINEFADLIRLGDIPKDRYVTVGYTIRSGGEYFAELIQVL